MRTHITTVNSKGFTILIQFVAVCTLLSLQYLLFVHWYHIFVIGWAQKETCYLHGNNLTATSDWSKSALHSNKTTNFYWTPNEDEQFNIPKTNNSTPAHVTVRKYFNSMIESSLQQHKFCSSVSIIKLSNISLTTKDPTTDNSITVLGHIWIKQSHLYRLLAHDNDRNTVNGKLEILMNPNKPIQSHNLRFSTIQTCYVKNGKISLEKWSNDPKSPVILVTVGITLFELFLIVYFLRYYFTNKS